MITPIISCPNPIFDHLLESSRRDYSNECSNIGFGQEIYILEIKLHILSIVLRNFSHFCTESKLLCFRIQQHCFSITRLLLERDKSINKYNETAILRALIIRILGLIQGIFKVPSFPGILFKQKYFV